jgi:hypothetical protein
MVLVAALAAAGSAAGAGGTSIASSPIVSIGALQSADTSSDQTSSGAIGSPSSTGCWNDLEYWRLPLTAGDAVLIKASELSLAHNIQLGVFPAGTTDTSIHKTDAILDAFPDEGPIRFSVKESGTYPLVAGPNCYDGVDGPFNFTVTVTHHTVVERVRIGVKSVATTGTSGVVTATAHTPSGALITDPKLQLGLYGTWKSKPSAKATTRLLSTGSPKQGTVQLDFSFPSGLKGTKVALHVATKPGGPYASASSKSVEVTVVA